MDDSTTRDLGDWPARPARAPRAAPVIRVLVADDVRIVRDTLVALLELEDDLEVVAELASGDEIVPVALRRRPNVAIIDIDLPGLDGLTAAAELHQQLPQCRTLILTALTGPEGLRRALAAGVSGFMVKDGPADDLIDAVRRTAGGEQLIDPRASAGR
jgi:two-component system, NarL family, response regulator DesR